MKRLLLVLLALVPGLVLFGWLGTRGDGAVGRWQPLPGGGEVRVRAITYGDVHEIEYDDRSLLQRARDWWKGPRPKGKPSPFAKRKVSPGEGFGLVIWLETRHEPVDSLPINGGTLHLPDGETLVDFGAGSTGRSQGRTLHHVYFSAVPYRARTLRLSWKLGEQEITFTMENPAARQRLPEWTPRPLPQTARNGDVELTLRSVRIEPEVGDSGLGSWQTRPEWSVTRAGADATGWYSFWENYSDPGGNVHRTGCLRAEPVWRLQAKAQRSHRFPFTEDDIHWLGVIDPAVRTIAGLPLDAIARQERLNFIGALDAGKYKIDVRGIVTAVPDETKMSAQERMQSRSMSQPSQTVELSAPALVVVTQGSAPFLTWRGHGGKLLPFRMNRRPPERFLVQILPLPEMPTEIGVAERKDLEFNFYIAAPERPKGVPSPPPR